MPAQQQALNVGCNFNGYYHQNKKIKMGQALQLFQPRHLPKKTTI